MLRESCKRPSIVVAGWTALVIAVFVWRGDLRVRSAPAAAAESAVAAPRDAANEPPGATATATSAPASERGAPVVVRPQRAVRDLAPSPVRTGRVFDARGFLLVGAFVRVDGREAVRTDADGRFELALGDGASADVAVLADGHRPHRLRVFAASPEPILVQLALAAPGEVEPAPLPPLPLVGEGRVRAPDGRPLVAAIVTELGSGAWVRTDATGRYQLPLSGAMPTIVVHADADNLAVRSAPLRLERERGIVPLPELVAAPACAVGGTIRDATGAPVAGVPVRLRGSGLERLVESGAGGSFRIAGLEPGHYVVRPFASRGALGAPQALTLDRPEVAVDLSLRSATERRLHVVDQRGAPVAAATVIATFAGERTAVQRTDGDGFVPLRVAADADPGELAFDVRVGAEGTPVPVERFEAPATLVVAGQ
ncbi:MAG: carboxypeptidase regulatory-like domain-containing protein [Planctomycetes bacterium]|nr:carboxypeptidase regulatory-like domain-containing protein [Planctomycetota bacterium]